jgi:hypothetical protein
MTKQVQLRRGTTTEHSVFTGAVGELTIDTDKDVAVVHDGTTIGGHELVGVAATGQTIVNKDGIAIGSSTLINGNELTVVGDSYVSGGSSIGGSLSVSGDITVDGKFTGISTNSGVTIGSGATDLIVTGTARITDTLNTNTLTAETGVIEESLLVSGNITVAGKFTGITTDRGVTIGSGATDLIVTGTARITNTLSIGDSTIVLNGNTNTLTAETGIFSQLNVTGDPVTISTYQKIVTNTVDAGATIIPLENTFNLISGDLLTIDGKFNNVPIVGLGTTTVPTYYVNQSSTSISTTVSIGSTVILVSDTTGINTSIQNYVSISTIFSNVPVVGYTSVALPAYYDSVSTTSISTTVSIGSTIIPLSIGPGILTTSSYLNVDGIFSNVPIVGVTTVALPPFEVTYVSTSIGSTVAVGSTEILLTTTSGINTVFGNLISIAGIFTSVPIVGINTLSNIVLIGAGNTSNIEIGLGVTVSISYIQSQFSNAAIIGIGNTYNLSIPTGTSSQITQLINPVSSAVLIGTANTSSSVISTGSTVTFSTSSTVRSIVVIGSASTIGSSISAGSTALFARQQAVQTNLNVNNLKVVGVSTIGTVTIGSGSTSFAVTGTARITDTLSIGNSGSIQTVVNGTGVAIATSILIPGSSLTVAGNSYVSGGSTIGGNLRVAGVSTVIGDSYVSGGSSIGGNLGVAGDITVNGRSKFVGITTLEQLVLANLNFPTADGLKGQVLATDGEGNIGFTTGGGSGGSAVVFRVSSNTGSDNNDGRILPVATIKKATQLASFVGEPCTILVETGEYIENNPIILYDEVSIIGDSLRNIIVRPFNAGKDLFKVRNGNYVTGMTFNDYINPITRVPQHTYNYSVAFDDPYDTLVDRTGYASTSISTITNVNYVALTGVTTITTSTPHELSKENSARLSGIAFTCGYDEAGINTFKYTQQTGVSTITLYSTPTNISIGNELFLHNLPLSCGGQYIGVTTTIFPDGTSEYGRVFTVTGVNTAAKTLTFLAGISTIVHNYVGYNTAGISTLVTTPELGITTVTVASHNLVANDNVTLVGLSFTAFSFSNSGFEGSVFRVNSTTSTTITVYTGISTQSSYLGGGFIQKVPTIQKVIRYPESNPNGKIDFGVVSVGSSTQFTVRSGIQTIPHYYTQGGTVRLSKPIINKSPYIQNCSILSVLGGNGILVDGNKVANINESIIPELGERPTVGAQPEFGKSMVAATFTMISFGGIGWRTINDAYAQVVSCFQIFCRYASLTQSGGYLSITNSATNFGDFALRSTGFSSKSFTFDRGHIAATGTKDGLQTLKVIGLGRTDQDLYVLQFLDGNFVNRTGEFKPIVSTQEFTGGQISTITNIFNIPAHPFSNLDNVVYLGNEDAAVPEVIGGMVPGNQYYVSYIDASNFRLYQDEGLDTIVSLGSTFVGINTLTKNNQEFFVKEVFDTHGSYQTVSLASTSSTLKFISGKQVTQAVSGGTAVGFALTFNSSTRQLVVSVEASGGVRRFFSGSGSNISDHNESPISIGVTAVAGITTYKTTEFKVDSTVAGTVITGVSTLPENYYCHFHRPSIINSSGHTWEYSGSGTDYNALPQNGGKGDASYEQVSELGGRVYASGTNELGDFKIGNSITAYNRTGNIIFNNKVTIGQLDSIRLSLSGGVAVEEFSVDVNLGESEIGGPQNKRVSTQLAVRSFLGNRLGTFIDKTVSSNAVPNAVVQLNSNGQINADLIPPKIVNYNLTNVGAGRTFLVNQIPAVNLLQGDTVVEPDDAFVLVQDVLSQYLIFDSETSDYSFAQGSTVTSALSESVTGIVTTPPRGLAIGVGSTGYADYNYVGYGSTGFVKGVFLSGTLTNAGSGYNVAGVYTGVNLISVTGVGTQATANITIGAGGSVTNVDVHGGGRYYAYGNVVSAASTALGGRTGGADFQFTITDVESRLYVKLTNNQKFAGSGILPDYIADDTAVSISTSLTASYEVSFIPTDISVGGEIDFANDRILVGAGNSFVNGDPVIYDSNGSNIITVGGLGIIDLSTYYVKVVGAGTSVELHRTYQLNDILDLTGSGTGTHKIQRRSINVLEGAIIVVGHGYSTGTALRVSGNTPTGINTNAFYYTGSVTTNSFTLHVTQNDALTSINGVGFNIVSIASTSTGTFTLTKQNVRYVAVVNTSSTDVNNWSLLAQDSIDAANIVSGVISPTRLGTGSANSDTVLTGTSEYVKNVFSVGIGTTQPLGIVSYTSADLAPDGVGINTYYGNINLSVVRSAGSVDTYSTLGVARFKTSTFLVDTDGRVQIRNSVTGDVDASTLGGQSGTYYLNSLNHTGSIPLTRGGTGLTGVPAIGAILIGNGSAYNLTTDPVFAGNVTFNTTVALGATQGTAPLVVTSTTRVNNLNVERLSGARLGDIIATSFFMSMS